MATDFRCRQISSSSTGPSTSLTTVSQRPETLETRSGDAVFEVCDGTRIRFSLPRLEQVSTFFRNLNCLPVSSEDDNGLPLYSLPSASANGLQFTFNLLSALMDGHPPLPFEVAPFEDVLIIADAYDLPLITTWLTLKSALLLDKDPFIPYTIASLTGDRGLEDMAIKKAIGRDISRMPTWANSLLKRHAPMALIRLYELQAEHAAALDSFGRKMRTIEGFGGAQDFSEVCKGGEGCPSYRTTGGDWLALKTKCADMVLHSFARHGGRGMDPTPIKDVTIALAWCGRCQLALEKSCMTAWRDTLGDLAGSATA